MGKLTWFRMDFDVVAQMKKVCDNDYAKIGELFCAVMQTAETGESVAFSDQNLQTAYDMICVLVQRARSSYDKKCEKRAAAGSKGGKAKAAKQKSETAESANDLQPVFKPPTKTRFCDTAKHFYAKYEEDEGRKYDRYEVENLFKKLKAAGWYYFDFKIQTDDLIDAIIVAELVVPRYKPIAFHFAQYCKKHEEKSFSLDAIEWVGEETDVAPPWTINGKQCTNLRQAVEEWYSDDVRETDEADDHADPPKTSRDYSSF